MLFQMDEQTRQLTTFTRDLSFGRIFVLEVQGIEKSMNRCTSAEALTLVQC